jgi:hypothetical protein
MDTLAFLTKKNAYLVIATVRRVKTLQKIAHFAQIKKFILENKIKFLTIVHV